MGSETQTEVKYSKIDWKIAFGALFLGAGIPLLLFVGVFYIQYLNKETASVIRIENTCFVDTLKGAGKNRYTERDIASCDDISQIYERSPSRFIDWGYASKVRVAYVFRKETFEADINLFEHDSRVRAAEEGIVWIARANNRKGRLTVIDNKWHALRFAGTGIKFLWETQKGVIVFLVFVWVVMPFARIIYNRIIRRS